MPPPNRFIIIKGYSTLDAAAIDLSNGSDGSFIETGHFVQPIIRVRTVVADFPGIDPQVIPVSYDDFGDLTDAVARYTHVQRIATVSGLLTTLGTAPDGPSRFLVWWF